MRSSEPPLVEGGQGKTARDVEVSAWALTASAVAAGLLLLIAWILN